METNTNANNFEFDPVDPMNKLDPTKVYSDILDRHESTNPDAFIDEENGIIDLDNIGSFIRSSNPEPAKKVGIFGKIKNFFARGYNKFAGTKIGGFITGIVKKGTGFVKGLVSKVIGLIKNNPVTASVIGIGGVAVAVIAFIIKKFFGKKLKKKNNDNTEESVQVRKNAQKTQKRVQPIQMEEDVIGLSPMENAKEAFSMLSEEERAELIRKELLRSRTLQEDVLSSLVA
jgi:hypothetical protein